ncbi:SGNH hydrolase [Actinorhabdospora filicis]|uniref:SGNH hydrolase n=1 Tax=Actinorhabdospora filicis TaxID=1785913 RepID=A0A9W6SQQ2_9ACTN|nr:SGNH/GDSL hydrolase family protein [Actinorhabdospora filicis]GLZ81194.1 SGNH hydrolase [Actinorhabdospora filicis]
MRWKSFLAIGDSFTEGMDDALPDGTYRGWADLLAESMAAADPDFRYANLAVRGKLFDEIVDEQVPVALRAAPELVSFAGGGNDALRPNFNPHTLGSRLHEVVRMLSAMSSTVVLITAADVTHSLPARRFLGPRVRILNDAIRRVAERHDAILVDLWPDPAFHDRRMWSVDRLHLSELGHQRVAALVQQALGIDPEPSWIKPMDPVPPPGWFASRRSDAAWAKVHLAPWIKRRLVRESSGDEVAAKRPELRPWSDGVS